MDKEEQIASMQRKLEDLDLIYQYLTGPRFRQHLEAIVEKFSIMQTDLRKGAEDDDASSRQTRGADQRDD